MPSNVLLGNYFQSTDASTMTSGAASAVLASTAGFVVPGTSQFGVVRVDDVNAVGYNPITGPFEIIYFTTNTTGTNTLSGFTRGQEGTSAHAFAAGSQWSQIITAASLNTHLNLQPTLRVRAFRSAALVVATATDTAIPYDTSSFDPATMRAGGNFTIPAGGAGYYYAAARISFATSSTTRAFNSIFVNGAERSRGVDQSNVPTGNTIGLLVTDVLSLAAADVVTFHVQQISGGNSSAEVGTTLNWASLHYLGS